MTTDIFTNDFTTTLVDPIGSADSSLVALNTPSLTASSVSGTQYRGVIDTSNGTPYSNTEIVGITRKSK